MAQMEQNIRLIRRVICPSQQEFGREEFSASYVSRVERGLQKPSRRFVWYLTDRLRYHTADFYQPGQDGHLIDTLLHMAHRVHESGHPKMAEDLVEQALPKAYQTLNPLIIARVMGFRFLFTDRLNSEKSRQFWEMVQWVDWNRATPDDVIRFVKVLGLVARRFGSLEDTGIGPMQPSSAPSWRG